MNVNDLFLGKVVAVRGIGSGVNVGRVVSINPTEKMVILTDSFYLRNWTYANSCGAFHSLSKADITGGEHIVKVHNDTIIMDVAQMVICPDELLIIVDKFKTVD